MKKRTISEGVSGFIAKNMHICIYTNLYFLTTNGGQND